MDFLTIWMKMSSFMKKNIHSQNDKSSLQIDGNILNKSQLLGERFESGNSETTNNLIKN